MKRKLEKLVNGQTIMNFIVYLNPRCPGWDINVRRNLILTSAVVPHLLAGSKAFNF